jgi:serine phosphatase RsbU (regulator of sigma subunit)
MSEKRLDSFKASEEVLLLLEDAKQKLDQSIDRLPGIYFIIDQDGMIYRTNYEMQKFLKEESSLTEEICFFDYLPAEDVKLLKRTLTQSARVLGMVIHQEVTLVGASNNKAHYSLSLYSWATAQGVDSVFFTIHGRDVSLLKEVSQQKELLIREIKGAEQIQQLMLPKGQLDLGKAEISCFYRSASECGGDFLFYNQRNDILKIWSGDVTGHGVGPSMISGAMRAAISVMESDATELNPLEAMQKLNDCLCDIAQGKYWMTFQIAHFDLKNEKVRLCQAGHTEVYAISRENIAEADWKEVEVLDYDRSHPLGINKDSEFHYVEVPMLKNYVYLSFSDGLYETTNKEERIFGKRRLLKSFIKAYGKNQDLKFTQEEILKELATFRNHGVLEDDLSYWSVAIKA